MEGFEKKAAVKVLTITGPSPNASNEPEDCRGGECVTTVRTELQVGGNRFSYRFPKHSVTVFVFSGSGSDDQAPRVPEYLDVGADSDVTYTYAVTAVDRSGNESSLSGKVSVVVGKGDDRPVGVDRTPPSPPILMGAR